MPLFAQLLAQNDTANTVTLVLAIILILVVGFILIIFFAYFRLWIQSVLTGANITIGNLLGMTFRKVNPKIIVQAKIMATQAGFTDEEFTTTELEAHLLAGGNVPLVIRALIAARKAKTIKLSFREATAIDLAGRNVLEALREADLDEAEGADMLMVKPALAYLDVIQAVRGTTTLPLSAYNVSGEYAMLKAAAANGWVDEQAAMLETLTSIKRAGADIIITYFAKDAAKALRARS